MLEITIIPGSPAGIQIPRHGEYRVTWPDSTTIYYKDSMRHRTDGPAYISGVNGHKGWYINAIRCLTNKEFQQAAYLTDEEMLAIVIKYGNVGDNQIHS